MKPVASASKGTGRNGPCPCGSGRKAKACCGAGAPARPSATMRTGGSPAARDALARAAAAADRPAEAVALLMRSLATEPDHPELRVALGRLLLALGRPQEAVAHLDHAVRVAPHAASARVQQGVALEQLGWHAEAEQTYRRAIADEPRHAEAHARLGIVLVVQERRAEAAQAFRRAATLAPDTSHGRLAGAYALLAEGSADAAMEALRRVVALEPANASAWAELGKLLAEAGDAPEAWAAFERVVERNPRAAGHYHDLARIRRLTDADRPLLQRMLAAADRTDLPTLHRSMLELAIGKAFDDLGDPRAAMAHYVEGNRVKGRLRPLDRTLVSARVDRQIGTFTKDFFAARAGRGARDATPLLVLGMPRSGTTLVESILARHGDVGAGQELSFWGRRGGDWMADRTPPRDALFDALAGDYLAVLREVSGAPRVTDKKPDNFFWAGLIHATFPNARIVHCRRDPLDTATSIVANFFAPRPDFSGVPEDLVFYHREYERIVAHWERTLPPDRFLTLDYEALVTEPEPQIRRLLAFCDLPWQEACLHPEESRRRVNTASLWQIRRPIFTGSIGRWRRYEGALGALAGLARTSDAA